MDGRIRVVVTEGTRQDLGAVFQRMREDFPPRELMSEARIEWLMAGGQYKLYLATQEGSAAPLGYALIFEPAMPQIAWLDYFAIDAGRRGAGYGTAFFHGLCERLRGQRQGIMLEVEPATSEDAEVRAVQRRRIAFYERNGARRLDVAYLFPVRDEPYPLDLYYQPIVTQNLLPKERIEVMIRAAYDYLHGDVATRHSTLRRVVASIKDQPL